MKIVPEGCDTSERQAADAAGLNPGELLQLAKLETAIDRGLQSFFAVGAALKQIRDSKLYRQDHGTFEDYCDKRWGFKRAHAYRFIESATLIEDLSPMGDILPTNERQCRPLAKLPDTDRQTAWQTVIERATETEDGTKVITAKLVEEVVEELRGPTSEPHVSHNCGQNEWYTPPEYIEAARQVMGRIDLDPASCDVANDRVQAANIFTKENSGLDNEWHGNVWMNPPYAQPLIQQFAERVVQQYQTGNISQAIVLVNNGTETKWFQTMASESTAVCFPKGRIRFIDQEGNSGAPLQGQAVLYFGNRGQAFVAAFSSFGDCWKPASLEVSR